MKTVRIIALHLAYGGIEKAIISMANLLVERYAVEILCVYNMPNSPAFPLDERVKVHYLLKDIPNRAEWKAAVKAKNPIAVVRESVRSIGIILAKKQAVKKAVRSIHDGAVITTRHEDNLVLSKYGDPRVLKIAQIHHDHRFEKKYVNGIRRGYGRLDVLAMLTPGLADEAKAMMREGAHTHVCYIPNFLEHFPENVRLDGREKRIVAVGRLTPVKGFDRLIRIFKTVHDARPDWMLEIIGDGAEKERLEALATELGLAGAVSLPGQMDSFQVEAEMRRAALYAMSSLSEGFPFVLVEALSCGLPVVSFDIRVGPGYILTHGADGFLVPDGDEAGFASRLLELIDAPALREQMGVKAMARAKDFTREKIGEMWFSLIGD